MASTERPPSGGALQRRVVALVRSVHGLHGMVRVEVLTDHPEDRFAPGSVLFRESSAEPLTVTTGELVPDGPGWRLRFREIQDRSAAERLRGSYLEAELGSRPVFRADGEGDDDAAGVWWDEVVGVPVLSPSGEALGTIGDVYRAGAADVYAVEGGTRGDFELPAVRDFILEFAPRQGRIVVDPVALDLPPAGRRARPRGRRTVRAARANSASTANGEPEPPP
ncbi:MAG TPA: ribosome maturation factor RimM [Candidatus Limnocylindrales bacterium]|nr:ribosome maturation factor RimM [Candidatus Limnocylindrales bacterium]